VDAAAHVRHGLLGAGVEGVRLAGRIQLEQRQIAAVVHLHGFARGHAGAGDELEAVGQVHEADFAVVGANAFFHGVLVWCREPRRDIRRTFRNEAGHYSGSAAGPPQPGASSSTTGWWSEARVAPSTSSRRTRSLRPSVTNTKSNA